MSKLSDWLWQDFQYASGKSGMDSRRAAFWLYDFVREFGIEQFQVVGTSGEWQMQRIEILYRLPADRNVAQVELEWSDFIEDWKEKH